MTRLEQSWQRAWRNLNLATPEGLSEHHTLQHLSECIAHFESAIDLAIHPGEVEVALWFHDAIYELKAKDNELRSAEWASRELSKAGASAEQVQRVHALIMATCHTATPIELDQQLLVDIDLAILGADPARFAEYDRQVRAEYSWAPGFIYRMKRKEVLKGFLNRPTIYSTSHFRERHEQNARTNLRGAT